MAIQPSYSVTFIDAEDVMVMLRFIIPRTSIREGMTPQVDEVVLGEMSTALAQASEDMKEGSR